MSRTRFFLCCVAFAALAFTSASAGTVVKITVDDTIQPISSEYIARAIEHARQTNADAVLIELHTPGGLVDSTREIIAKILDSPVPVIVYVAPSGANAASAGFFILESADIAAMAPGTCNWPRARCASRSRGPIRRRCNST
jgi:membrane-bound serine protease (ClpP class)